MAFRPKKTQQHSLGQNAIIKIVKVCSFTDPASSFFADFQLQIFSCILCTASIHGVAHYWFIYHMQDKVTLDLDLELMSVRSYDQISAAGKTMLYFNFFFFFKDVQYIE